MMLRISHAQAKLALSPAGRNSDCCGADCRRDGTAEVFVAEGAKIVIAGRRIPEGEALAKDCVAALRKAFDR